MFQNYLKIAWRNLWKNKAISLINLLGLSVGLGFFFLTASYVRTELNVNGIIRDNERVLALRSKWKEPGMGLEFTTPAPVAQALYDQYPQLVEDFYHHDAISAIVSKAGDHFTESLQPGDATFLRITGFELLHGNAGTALETPNSLVLTAAKAKKYFGRTDVVGQALTIQSFSGERRDFTITGVLKDLPYNTITHYNKGSSEFFLPPTSLQFFGRYEVFQSWQNPYVISYVKLRPGVDQTQLQEPMTALLKQYTPPGVYENLQLYTTAVKDDYLLSEAGAARRMIYTMAIIACFILVMAGVNFVNTSMGNSLTRLKETGLKKVLGSTTRQIMAQFLIESVVFVCCAGVLALGMYQFGKPPFAEMLGKQLPELSDLPPALLLFFLVIALVLGLLAGFYPAFTLSLQPSVASIKGKLHSVGEKIGLRRGLLAVQFITALIVFISAVVVHEQVEFFFNSDLGYDKSAVVVLKAPRDWTENGVRKMQAFRNELARLPEVTSASFSYEVPDGQSGSISNQLYQLGQDSTHAITTTSLITDEFYTDTYGISMAAGAFFAGSGTDETNMILNENAAQQLGWPDPEAAIGQSLRLQGSPQTYTVRGVVRDFHFNTMHEPIRPLFFLHVTNAKIYRYFSLKVKPGNMTAHIVALQDKWQEILPDAPFDLAFMDDTLARRYQNELQLKQASQAGSLIALLIVLLGVVGIVLLAVARRTREVGIRTVLGAGLGQIVWLFAREFTWIILLGSLVAWPVAWLFMQKWLATYAYQASIGLFPFAAVSLFIAGITGLLILWLVWKKAIANPVETLRSE